MTPMHLGAMHPFEQALTLVLAFGPFAVLGIVIWLRRREDDAEDARTAEAEAAAALEALEAQRER